MGRIVINNETRWNTRDLRKFITAGLRAEVGNWFGTYRVDVKRGRRHQNRAGWGYYNYRHMCLFLNDRDSFEGEHIRWESYKEADEPTRQRLLEGWHTRLEVRGGSLRWLGIVIAHEADHNKGERHKDMSDRERTVEWADKLIASGFVIRLDRPKPAKPKPSVQETRAAHARKMLDAHEQKLEREKRLVAKWAKKVRYYERATATKAAKRKEPS